MKDRVEIVEVGPRDGLQNEDAILSTELKVELIGRLVASGLRRIEVASFARPDLVPQLADAESVVAGVSDKWEISPIGLVMNRHGFDRVRDTQIEEVNFVVPVTDQYSLRNQGKRVEELVDTALGLLPEAKSLGLKTTVTLSVAFGCPFEGEVDQRVVLGLAERFIKRGVDELAFADSIGVADPGSVRRLVDSISGEEVHLRCHFHNTRNTGVANALAAYEAGVSSLDASVAGIGGCPFAPAATGNVGTEDLVYLFERLGVETQVNPPVLIGTAIWLASKLQKEPDSMVARAGWFPSHSAQLERE